jgi:predicted O-linked N-acetylglucosamine transferase (SPINDLY family)
VLSIVQRTPGDLAAHAALVDILLRLRQTAQALFAAERAAAAAAPSNPDHAAALVAIAWRLHDAGHWDNARRIAQRACDLAPPPPADARATEALLLILQSRFRYTEMAEQCRRLLQRGGPATALTSHLAGALLSMGEAEQAVRLCRDALAASPGSLGLAVALAGSLNYLEAADPAEVQRAHRDAAALLERATAPLPPVRSGEKGGDRLLRVGLVSPDLRAHAVASFVESFLPHVAAARDPIEVVCYHTGFAVDEVSRRLAAAAALWRHVNALTDDDLAAQVRQDRVDVLVDLGGWYARGRLGVFARRPAPVQATWLGYPNTTGMTRIDWRLVDSTTDPAGAEAFASERLLRLDPCFICYRPPDEAPALAPAPCAGGAEVTFGSFNSLQKLSPGAVAAWSRLLGEIPSSRLLLKNNALTDEGVRAMVLRRFEDAGADPSRIELLGRIDDPGGHLAAYGRVDVALDTFPYGGTTTTCEALLMGVPVVSRRGPTHASRVGDSLLGQVGLRDLVVETWDDYVRTAAALARERDRLAALRRDLRPRLLASPLCDGPAFAARFASAVHRMWRETPR